MKTSKHTAIIFACFVSSPALALQATQNPGMDSNQASSLPAICDPPSTTVLQGVVGVMVSRCYEGANIYGVGDNVDDAATNANGFLAVFREGVHCTMSAQDPVHTDGRAPGVAFMATCEGFPIWAFGQTATSSGKNVLEIAINMAGSGMHCSANSFNPSPHGLQYGYSCSSPAGSAQVSGYGSNVDDANSVAMRAMKVSAQTGRNCSFESMELRGVTFYSTLVCANSRYTGMGRSVSASANDAMLQAGG